MAIDRVNLKSGPAKVTYDSATYFTREDIVVRHDPRWEAVPTSMHGVVDDVALDLVIPIGLRLWGAWENLTKLFPAAFLTPDIGARVYGTSDLPLVIHGKNGDLVTYHNARLTRMADLFLGVDAHRFEADAIFTALLKNNTNPEAADSYFTQQISQAYTDTTFAMTNYKRERITAAWGAVAGFTAIIAKSGWRISWDLVLAPDVVDGHGTVDMIVEGLKVRAMCIPIGPTMAQVATAANLQGTSNPLGRLSRGGATVAADLVLTGAGTSLTLKNAAIKQNATHWGVRPLRQGEVVWETTVGFTAGVAAARAVVS